MSTPNVPIDPTATVAPDLAAPEPPPFADDGTDLTVIRWMLDKTPEERLRWLQAHMQAVMKARHARTRP